MKTDTGICKPIYLATAVVTTIIKMMIMTIGDLYNACHDWIGLVLTALWPRQLRHVGQRFQTTDNRKWMILVVRYSLTYRSDLHSLTVRVVQQQLLPGCWSWRLWWWCRCVGSGVCGDGVAVLVVALVVMVSLCWCWCWKIKLKNKKQNNVTTMEKGEK